MGDITSTSSVIQNNNYINQKPDPLRGVNPIITNSTLPRTETPQNSTRSLQFRPENRENDVQVGTRNDTPFQPTGVQFGDRPSPTMNTGGREISRQEATEIIKAGRLSANTQIGGITLNGTVNTQNGTAQFRTKGEAVLGRVPVNIQTEVELGRGGKPASASININRDLGRYSGIQFNLSSQGNQKSANISFSSNFNWF